MPKSREQALDAFWNSFQWAAYDENTVPDDAELPRITYNVAVGSLNSDIAMQASLWIRSTSWDAITQKADEIGAELERGGRMIPYTGGGLWIRQGTPFAQRMNDPDDTIRRIYLNVAVEYIE